MTEDDIMAVHETTAATFEDLGARHGMPPHPRPDPAMAHIRYHHLVTTDPEGSLVAEDEQGVAGVALAIRREHIWGLSLLIVRPDQQSTGLGRELLRRANDYADGARGRIILSSPDSRAMRAYSRLGLDIHPCVDANGVPRGVDMPDGVREGGHDDIPFTAEVDLHVRGAAHGDDIGAQLRMGQTLLLSERGYAVTGNGELRLLAAFDEDAATELMRAVFAHAGDSNMIVSWITSSQQWAARVCVEAGMKLTADAGAVFVDGDVGRFQPYIPSGAFL